jgi:DNA processing protein
MDGADVLDDLTSLFPTAPNAPKVQESLPAAELSLDERILYDAIGTDEAHINDITTKSGLTPATVNATLMRLEMKRLLRALPGRRYVRLV